MDFLINAERVVQRFLDLVRLNSPSRRERPLADYVKAWAGEQGLTVEEDEAGATFGGECGNLYLHLPAQGKGGAQAPPLLLSAHLDIVAEVTRIKPRLEAGVIKTDGETVLGADDKAGVVAIMEALTRLQELDLPHGEIEVVFSVGEEIGLRGALALRRPLQARLGFVFDSSDPVGTIIVRAPGQKEIWAKIHGRAAHAGVAPEKGINAIVIASRAIANMPLGRLDEETTANIGLIQGGEATNIVPEYAEVRGEARSFLPEKLAAQVERMLAAFREAAQSLGGSVDLEVKDMYATFHLETEAPVVRLAQAAIRSLGLEPRLAATGGGSDANIYNQRGIPTVNLGLAMQNEHTKQERIAVSDLVQGARLALSLIAAAVQEGEAMQASSQAGKTKGENKG